MTASSDFHDLDHILTKPTEKPGRPPECRLYLPRSAVFFHLTPGSGPGAADCKAAATVLQSGGEGTT